MDSIDVDTLNDWRNKKETSKAGSLMLLDVRDAWEFEHCHIEGSVNIPMQEVTHRLGELDASRDIVVICHHGARSMQVGYFLENAGLNSRIMNLEGGIDAWADRIDPDMPRY